MLNQKSHIHCSLKTIWPKHELHSSPPWEPNKQSSVGIVTIMLCPKVTWKDCINKQWNYKKRPIDSSLITNSKQGGTHAKSKEPYVHYSLKTIWVKHEMHHSPP